MSLNAVYNCGKPAFINAAVKLEKDIGLCPKYWVAKPYLKEKILTEFPEIDFHSSIDLRRGIGCNNEAIDAVTLSNYDSYFFTAFRIMNRMEVRNSFPVNGRIDHLLKLISHWEFIFNKKSIDCVIFSLPPHNIGNYILYAVAQEKGVDTLIVTPTKLPEHIYTRTTLHDHSTKLRSKYKSLPDNKDYKNLITEVNKKYVERLKGDYQSAEPPTEEKLRQKSSFIPHKNKLANILKYPEYIFKLFSETELKNEKYPRMDLENKYVRYYKKLYTEFRSNIKKKNLRRNYLKQATGDMDLTDDYIYVPLHYQPERTTDPEGGYYANQKLMLELISSHTPKNVNIFVKEHPAQFYYSREGEKGRTLRFYEDISRLNGVEFVDLSYNPFDLIDNSMAVATVTGTTGWEAIIRGKPALVFGNPWYRPIDGCYHIETTDDIKNTLYNNAMHGTNLKEVYKFIYAIECTGVEGFVTGSRTVEESRNKQNLTLLLKNSIQTTFDCQ